MMATVNELERVAAMANSLRPEWPVQSLLTHLKAHHGTRPYRDLAVAMAWVATDPDTQTPARLKEAGPWWNATSPSEANSAPRGSTVCPRCRYPHPPAVACESSPASIDRGNPDRLASRHTARALAKAAAHGTREQENPT